MTCKPILAVILLCSRFIFIPASILVFASSGNWVEVTRFTGHGGLFGDSSPFRINHVSGE